VSVGICVDCVAPCVLVYACGVLVCACVCVCQSFCGTLKRNASVCQREFANVTLSKYVNVCVWERKEILTK
jgi:hypothetical protein